MRRSATAVAITLACVLWVAATAAGGRQSNVPLPSLASMALAPSDFAAGAKVATESKVTAGGNPSLLRVFKPGLRLGSQRLLTVVSQVTLYADSAGAAKDFVDVQSQTRTKPGRQTLAKEIAAEFEYGANLKKKGALTVTRTVVGAPVMLGVSTLRLPMTLSTNVGTLHIALAVTQIDRVVAVITLFALYDQNLATNDVARAAAAAEAHPRAAFTIANTAAPTVGGAAQQGQTLTADEGTWTGAPSSFVYAWVRCDASGNTCTPINGATAKTYTIGAADSGATLRVTVNAANSVSSQQAASAATAAIP
jgi:hypothetical protein